MPSREDLQTLLETLADNVYFQPPETVKLAYPCIIYKRETASIKFANDKNYMYRKGYQISVIDPDPDSPIPDLVAALPLCSFNRHYTADNLNHDVFILYY